MPDKYRLLKDIPDADVGTVLTLDEKHEVYNYTNKQGENSWYEKVFVEKNITWFQKIEEKLYTEKDMEDCFNAARKNYQGRCDYSGYPFASFYDYLTNRARQLQSKDR